MSRSASHRRHQSGAHRSQKPVPNPQVALAKLDGATNTVPSFITTTGPVREARFVATNSVYEPEISGTFCNSEANTVINNFNYLSTSQQQDLLNFLRSL